MAVELNTKAHQKIREIFEECAFGDIDLTKNDDGDYVSSYTLEAWKEFLQSYLHHEEEISYYVSELVEASEKVDGLSPKEAFIQGVAWALERIPSEDDSYQDDFPLTGEYPEILVVKDCTHLSGL